MAKEANGAGNGGRKAKVQNGHGQKAADQKRGQTNAKARTQGQRPSPESKSLFHGAEAVTALAVQEHKTSQFKTKMILGLILILVASLSWNSVQSWTRPEPKLLGMTTDGRVQELPLLDKPLSNRQVLIDWVKRHIPEMYDWNYANFRGELNQLLEFMRPVTLDSFRQQLDQSGILKRVREDFLILQGRITDDPLVQNEFVAQGTRVWVIEIPMRLIYESGEKKDGQRERITQDIIFRAYVARANPMEYPGGLILAKFEVSGRGRN